MMGRAGALALQILKYATGGSVGGLLSVALTSPQSPKLLLFPLEPNQSPQLCQWRPRLILRTTASLLEAGRAGVLDALQKQLLRGMLEPPHRPPTAITSSRRKLAPSLVDTKVINRNQYPKTQLDQPRSPWPLTPYVCVWRSALKQPWAEVEHLWIGESRSFATCFSIAVLSRNHGHKPHAAIEHLTLG